MSDLGDFMREARKRIRMPDGRRMSQEDLAEVSGLAAATIAQIENGRTQRPERETLERIAGALHVAYNDLVLAAGMVDPPSQRDVESEIMRLAAIPTIEDRMEALSRLSPEIYEVVLAWSQELLVAAARRRRPGDNRPAPGPQTSDQADSQSDGPSGP